MNSIFKVSFVILCAKYFVAYADDPGYLDSYNPGYLDVTEYYPFDHKSALQDQDNLKSKEYQDFIHELYSHDKDNLKKVDNLFAHPELAAAATATAAESTNLDPVIVRQPSTFTIRNNHQQKREIVFRPLFAYKQQGIRRRRIRKNTRPNFNQF